MFYNTIQVSNIR